MCYYETFKVTYLGGKQAGCVGLLMAMAANCNVVAVVAYDDMVKGLAEKLSLSVYDTINHPRVEHILYGSDLLLCVHGKEVVSQKLLALPRLGGVNVHPCLWKYKGAHSVERALEKKEPSASVGAHRMSEVVDSGEVLEEMFVDITGKTSVEEVYNALYPYYSYVILEVLKRFNPRGVF